MRSVAIITGPDTHLDHLGVLSSVIDIPLIVTDEKLYYLAKQFYPSLNATLIGLNELSIEHLANNYDVIFQSGKLWAAELKPFLEMLFHKKMRFVFCPHGNSDKGHTLQNHIEQDVSLVYGDHLLDLLKKTGAAQKISRIVKTGNYRLPFYFRNQIFYDRLAIKMVFDRFRVHKPVVFCAPTWSNQENPTSVFSSLEALIEQLCPSFNLLIKLHPFLFEDHPAQVYKILAAYENHPSAIVLEEFPPIYPLLAHCDLYLGDYSSIGYDFLYFDKPLYFLNPQKKIILSPLYSCGIEIHHLDHGELNQFLIDTLEMNQITYAVQRKKIYTYAFGEEQSPDNMRKNIFKALLSNEPIPLF